MGLKFTQLLMRCLLGPLGLSGPIAGASWTHSYSKQLSGRYIPLPSAHNPHPPPTHSLYVLYSSCEKIFPKFGMLAA